MAAIAQLPAARWHASSRNLWTVIDDVSKLQLEQQGEHYVLSNVVGGKVQTMTLTAADVLTICRSALQLQDRILGSQSRAGAVPHVSVPVARIELDHTVHEDEIVLRLDDRNGSPSRFLLTLQLAADLAQGLAARVVQLRQVAQNRSKQ
jgi:hypothetical protein